MGYIKLLHFPSAVRFELRLSRLLGDRSGASSRKTKGVNGFYANLKWSVGQTISFKNVCSAFTVYGLHLHRPRPSNDASPELRHSPNICNFTYICRACWPQMLQCPPFSDLKFPPPPLRRQDGIRWGWKVSISRHSIFWSFWVCHRGTSSALRFGTLSVFEQSALQKVSVSIEVRYFRHSTGLYVCK